MEVPCRKKVGVVPKWTVGTPAFEENAQDGGTDDESARVKKLPKHYNVAQIVVRRIL